MFFQVHKLRAFIPMSPFKIGLLPKPIVFPLTVERRFNSSMRYLKLDGIDGSNNGDHAGVGKNL